MGLRPRLELTVLTGFLGSGKTTLLRRELGTSAGQGVAVVINEFAEVGLDQVLVAGSGAACVLISGGCACCDRREELLAALHRLLDEHERGVLSGLRRVVIETSGLADPAPIAGAVAADPVLRHHFAPAAIVTVVDGLAGAEQLARHDEVKLQVHSADRIVISKTDLACAEDVAELERVLSVLNPMATIDCAPGRTGSLFGAVNRSPRTSDPASRTLAPAHEPTRAACLSLDLDEPLDWVAFGVWLSMLLHAHGRELLRVKGVIEASGLGAVAINTVQELIYPPEHLGGELDGRQARLVFIARDIEPQSIARSLRAFQRVA